MHRPHHRRPGTARSRNSGRMMTKAGLRGKADERDNKSLRLHSPSALWEDEEPPITVPTRWVKLVFGIFLLPVAWILGETFFSLFTHATVEHRFWLSAPFWFFSLGFVCWLIAFFGLPRPVLLYVFSHEFTHALWVWLLGGRVSRFRFGLDGGEVLTDKTNFWIALAPYFFPLYSMLVIGVFGILEIFFDLGWWNCVLYGLVGVTWGFHLTFTCWVIPKGQSDLTDHGTFFSLTVVFLMNLLVLLVFLIVASPTLSWHHLANETTRNAAEFARWITQVARAIAGRV